ncbi:MAG: glycerol-3-phosphate dehydrogenase/oxidase [Desulfobacterales bacterium]|nr:glycerol-3-phosphate dehydrogenase/oxidase [Desulfobacterales bacterium]
MSLAQLDSSYDIVIAGGGVTGAGTFSLAVDRGLKALLVDAKDFAWGTSSRSSKMVHGGLRYLKQGKFLLTRSAVKERERLLKTYPGLVTPLQFLMPIYRGLGPSRSAMHAGLNIYSLMAGRRQHRSFDRDTCCRMARGLRRADLVSGMGFMDAQVDDARLALRLIFDACDAGGHARNYTRAVDIGRNTKGEVRSVCLKDAETGREREIRTRVVINATGPFAGTLQASPRKGFHIRPLRGSHLIFPGDRYPLDRVLSFAQPEDGRPIFIFPWEGCLVLGTTDVDFEGDLNRDPGITTAEIAYLMEGLDFLLPDLGLTPKDAIAATTGIRPVLSRKTKHSQKSASTESREHVVWKDKGLVTVTGGKLTTFHLLARDALKAARSWLPRPACPVRSAPGLSPSNGHLANLTAGQRLRLGGRYGSRLSDLSLHLADVGNESIAATHSLWAELCHGASSEQVRHLSDLLLRRVRIGLLLPNGGLDMMDRIRKVASPGLNWDEARWEKEIRDYKDLWENAYSPHPAEDGHVRYEG